MNSVTIAVDLAKHVFELAVSPEPGRITERRRMSHSQFERFWATRAPCRVVMGRESHVIAERSDRRRDKAGNKDALSKRRCSDWPPVREYPGWPGARALHSGGRIHDCSRSPLPGQVLARSA